MDIILRKDSEQSDLKKYFEAILKLSEAEEEFPVDLDEVWMLVYSERGKAVRALKQNFIEGDDFVLLAQNGKRTGRGGSNKLCYRLTVRCMEYFVARKVRPVFEVYRKVFHKTIENGLYGIETKMKAVKWACELLNLNDASKLMMARSVLEPLGLPVPDYVQSKGVHHSAKDLLKHNNIPLSSQAFNKLALAGGFLEIKTRKSRKGEKQFYVISNRGLSYGENLVSDHNPNETQPHWYDERFGDLLKVLGIIPQYSLL